MKKLNLLLLCAVGLFLTLQSCKKDKEEPTLPLIENPEPNVSIQPGVLDLGSNVSAKFFARIVDENNAALQNVQVSVGNKIALTDANGIAMIPSVMVPEKLAYLTAVKPGYFLGSRSVIPQTTTTNEIKIILLQKNIISTIQAGEEATVSTNSGLKIDFKGEYVTSDGSVYTGSVNVAMKHIDPSSDDFSDQMPGSLYAQDESNSAGVLESYGMGAIEIFAPSGEELQIAAGSSATMRMPVTSAQLANAPSTIPLWHFDEIEGYWIEEGSATLINGEYVGDVNHFSFWNCDAFYDDAQITGTILDQSGNTISSGSVQILTPNASTTGQVQGGGTFSSYVPANLPVTFNVFDDCGTQISTWTNTFATNSNTSHVFVVANSSVNSITGTALNCNNAAVTNGYVVLSIGNNIYFPTLNTSGQFNFNLGNCSASNVAFTVEGFDYTSVQTSGLLAFSTTNPITNIGNIVACTTPSEYITYTIDSNPATSFFAPITCIDSSSTGSGNSTVTIYANVNNDYFSLQLENNVVGAYNFMDFGTSTPGASLSIPQNINTSNGNPNIIFNLATYGAVGTYVNISFSGTYLDQNNIGHTISGNLHVIRDN